jgi:hypothetical protein
MTHRFNELSHLCPTSKNEVGQRKAAPMLALSYRPTCPTSSSRMRAHTHAHARTHMCVCVFSRTGRTVGQNKQPRGFRLSYLLSYLNKVGHLGGNHD